MARLQTLKPRVAVVGARLSTMQSDSWRSDQQSSTARGYGYKWQQARATYLLRHPYCVYCLRDAGIDCNDGEEVVILACMEAGIALPHAQVVDHVVAHRGDMKVFWDSSNWQSLCTPHHSRDKQREEALAGQARGGQK